MDGSPAARAGLAVGDEIVSIDGEVPRDIIQWQMLVDEPDIEVAAIAAAIVLARRLGLDEPANRQAFVRTGRVPSDRLR